MQKILVIASHPDDEILGCGSTLRKHVLAGDEVYCLILGEGLMARENNRIENLIYAKTEGLNSLRENAKKAAKIIGFKEIYFESLPDNEFDTVSLLKITQIIEYYIKSIQPDILFVHHSGDLNCDHRIAFQASLTAARPGCSTVKEIYAFETPSSTEWAFDGSFKPNVFVNVMGTLEIKLKAIQCYTTEIREWPHPRSIRALRARAEYWGQAVGMERAEAFELVRKIN